MPFDTLVMSVVAREIGEMAGARVVKVYQPRNSDILIHLRKLGSERQLLISSAPDSARVHFVERTGENPKFPPMFCMLMRKYLEGSRFRGVSQPPYERVLFLDFEGRNDLGVPQAYTVVAEIMGRRSNIILLDGSGEIVDAMKKASLDVNQVREVLPGKPYVQPPVRPRVAPPELTPEGLRAWLLEDPSRTCEQLLVDKVMGVGPALARHVCAASGGAVDATATAGAVVKALQAAFEGTSGGSAATAGPGIATISPVIYLDGARLLDYYCFHLAQYGAFPRREYASMSEALDEFYTARASEDAFRSLAQSLRSTVRKAQERAALRLESQRRDLEEGMRAGEYRLYGELLTAYGGSVGRAKEARLPNYYIEGSPEVTIPLNPSLDAFENAQVYFKKYARAKSGYEQAEKRIGMTQSELAYLEQVDQTIEQASTLAELLEVKEELAGQGYVSGGSARERRASESHGRRGGRTGHAAQRPAQEASSPLTLRSPGGWEILVGRNNRQNDIITKSAQPDDIWLHAKQMPGAHVILRYPREAGRPPAAWPPDQALGEASALAAYFSKGRGNTKVPVDYTFARHVWKPRGAKPGMVLYDHQKTLFVEPRRPVS